MPQKFRNIIFYLLLFVGGGAFMLWIAQQGAVLELEEKIVKPVSEGSQWVIFLQTLGENFFEPFAILLAQIITIMVVARVCGFLFRKIGQPAVIGEILAGIILGPSLLGNYFPQYFELLFPVNSLANLNTISNIGLILFMFVVGMELDMKVLRAKISESIAISQAGIFFPFALGMGLSYFLYNEFVPPQVPFISFALFMGVSMSITAFPVLARIAQERGLSKTKLGTVILACAAINDIMAWCILAVIIAIAKAGNVTSSLYTIIFAIIYVLVMLKLVKPFLKKIADLYYSKENLNKGVVAVFFLVLLFSAFCTQMIGIHALFGAFMAGVIMPSNTKFRDIFVDKVEDVATVIFLPLFFVYTGLRTKIGLLNAVYLWKITGIIVLVAVVGKLLGSAFAARFVGRQSWRNSLITGTLMNTRGLMELVAINIGYDLGVISPEIFVMLVLMALITTFMTSPMLALIRKIFPNKEISEELERKQAQGIFKALIALGNPASGKYLLRVAKNVLDGEKNTLEVTALHITAGSDTNPLHSEEFMTASFAGIEDEATLLNVPLKKEYELSDNVENEILEHVNDFGFDFLLIGAGLSYSEEPFLKDSTLFGKIKWLNWSINKVVRQQVRFYPQTLIKDKTKFFIENAQCSVGIFINRDFHQITNTAVVLNADTDGFLLRYARRLLKNSASKDTSIVIYDTNNVLSNPKAKADFNRLTKQFPNQARLSANHTLRAIDKRYDFMLISYQSWNTFINKSKTELKAIPSTLIINKQHSRF
ncbi:MAG: cation:proton antiporter [Prevotellaceae bacterium]|jgi:Kef-type K+ transport system membrane component KefB|nr:cation:proton antiporter [Prevotellaceae bacterium]